MTVSMRSRWPRLAACALALAAPLAAPAPAEAFCGFYVSGSQEQLVNKATRVALMREGTRMVLSMSNDYEGPPQDFAMVVPVPVVLQRENVRTLPHDVFTHLESLTAPRLVEYWEQDPCAPPEPPMEAMAMPTTASAPRAPGAQSAGSLGVRIEARFAVGEYQILVLSATQSTGLETWLRQERYNIPQGAAEYLAPYVREQWKFFVARVDIDRAQRRPNGGARLSPLRFHYESRDFRLPVRLGLLNAGSAQDLIVYVLHPSSRFEVANYRNVFIPTNLDLAESARSQFGEFYARLFDYTLEQAGGRAVATEYAWSTSSCDPCPTPPLAQAELMTLGADVLGASRPGFDSSYHVYNMVVTRMHTRYNRATLTEDLVFREAPAIMGGREVRSGPNNSLEQGAQPSTYGNNFQARYAIRHPWTGRVACAHPRRGVWGGPPNGVTPPTVAARDLADVQRGRVNLASVLRSPLPPLSAGPAVAPPSPAPPVVAPPVRPPRGPRGPRPTSRVVPRDHTAHGALALGGLLAGGFALALQRRRR